MQNCTGLLQQKTTRAAPYKQMHYMLSNKMNRSNDPMTYVALCCLILPHEYCHLVQVIALVLFSSVSSDVILEQSTVRARQAILSSDP